MRQIIIDFKKRIGWLSVLFFVCCVMCLAMTACGSGKSQSMENQENAGEEYKDSFEDDFDKSKKETDLSQDGSYEVYLRLEGGSGKASVKSPAQLNVENGVMSLVITWSSPNYDYMIVDGRTYYPVNESGNSEFVIEIPGVNETFSVIADTVAMSTPHEIEYELTVSADGFVSSETGELVDAEDSSSLERQVEGEISTWVHDNFGKGKSVLFDKARKLTIEELDNRNLFITINNEDYYLALYKESNSVSDETSNNSSFKKSNAASDKEEKDMLDTLMEKAPENINVLYYPVTNSYVAASGSLDFFNKTGALDSIAFSSLQEKDCSISSVRQYIADGKITYAGKYSAPDYETLLAKKCDFILENTMIFHKPEVLEQLKSLGFSVLVDYSSLEEEVLGRIEWVKLYGYLTDRLDAANKVYEEQRMKLEAVSAKGQEKASEAKTVAFFSVLPSGGVTIRKCDDYICDMIRMAGGSYIFDGKSTDLSGSGSSSIQMEYFYENAKDADIIIYNGTIEGDIKSVDDLVAKNPLFKNFKAVQSQNVYCTGTGFYQLVCELSDITEDMYRALNNEETTGYLVRLR